MSKKDKVLFESKEYGIGGHNKLELRDLDGDGDLRLWIRDGEANSAICMDRADFLAFSKALVKSAKTAPLEVECFDFTKPIPHKHKKVNTTSEANGTKKPRKTRSDKGVKRVKA